MLLTEYDKKKQRKFDRQEGREETLEQLNQLTILLAEQGRMDDIVKAAKDREYQEQLCKEFGLEFHYE